MRRDQIATITSAALLSTSIVIWRDLFFFSKVAYLPAWTASLPSPIDTPRYLAFLCLMPAALFTSSLSAAIRSVAWGLFLAPLPAQIIYLAGGSASSVNSWFNAAFNYAWVIGFECLAPALVLLAVRAGAHAVKGRVGG